MNPAQWACRLFSICFLAVQSAASLGEEPGAGIDLSAYDMTFDEEFNTLDVSAWGPGTRWIAHTPWNGDFGDAAFANPMPDFPFTVSDGILRIEARRTPQGKWQSGMLAAIDKTGKGFAQKFGYFEIRARFPAGDGLWPAFWLIGVDRSTHTSEVDVVEHYGRFPGRYTASIHVWDRKDSTKSRSLHERVPVADGSLYSDFHSYGVSVEADFIRFYFDRREVWRTRTPAEHRQRMYPILNLGLGGGWPIDKAPSPAFLLVDYVRVWQRRT